MTGIFIMRMSLGVIRALKVNTFFGLIYEFSDSLCEL